MGSEKSTRTILLAAGAAAALFLVWQVADTLLLIFAGVLFGICLDALSRALMGASGLSRRWSLALTCLGLVAVVSGAVAWGGYALVQQWDALARTLTEQIQTLRSALDHLGVRIADATGGEPRGLGELLLPDPARLLGGARSAFSAAFGVLGSVVVVVLIGIFAAADPAPYRRGILAMVPPRHRKRLGETLDEIAEMLRWWLIGQFVTMIIIGATVAIVLTLLGMPGALLLGLQAGLLNFIPYLGPFLSAIPILLAAIPLGMSMIVWAISLYVLIQLIEGYVLMPLIQKRAVDLPPVLTLASLMLMGALFGGLGIALATPLVAAIRVATLRLYVDRIEKSAQAAA